MGNIDVDMQAYRLTEEQKAAMCRMFKDEADAEELLRMLGVIVDEKPVLPTRAALSIRCVKHDENKYRTRGGNLVCNSCRKAKEARRPRSTK